MPSLGKDNTSVPPFGGSGIISTSYTEECEVVDISNRGNVGGAVGGAGYKQMKAGFTKKTWEIETHDASGLVTALESAGSGFAVMSVTENISIDGAITFTVTALQV